MPIYKTAAQWATYFGGNTADQHKILVDILYSLENGGAGGGNIDGALGFEVIAPVAFEDVQTEINDKINAVKALTFKVVNVSYDMEFNNDNQQRYTGMVYYAFPTTEPTIIVTTPWSFSCAGTDKKVTNAFTSFNFTGQTITVQVDVAGTWTDVDSDTLTGFDLIDNDAVDGSAYPDGTFNLRMIDKDTGIIYYSQSAVAMPACV